MIHTGCAVTPSPATIPNPTTITSPTATSSSTEIQAVSTSTQGIQNIEMDLTQIQAGDYTSLLGTWTLAYYAINPFDGTGIQWYAGVPDNVAATLSVSTDKISFNDSAMVVQGNTLTDNAGSHLLSFVENGGFLDAELADANSTINWAVAFYPKGVANELNPNNGVVIDSTKNLIAIWYSGMQTETVFAQE